MTEKQLFKKAEEKAGEGKLLWFVSRGSGDIWGIFDAVALSQDGRVGFLQITTIDNKWRRLHKIKDFMLRKDIHRLPTLSALWCWDYNKCEFEVTNLND